MRKFIENMQERPEEERLAFAAMAAGAVALLLFLVWGTAFFSRGNTAQLEGETQSAAAFNNFEQIQSDFSSALNDFSYQYEQVQNAITGAENEVRTTNTVDLSVDENGDVRVDNIIVKEEELTN